MPTITQKFTTNNDCYKLHKMMTPIGVFVHSTATDGVDAPGWFSHWNASYKAGETSRQVAVHFAVDNKCIMQYLPSNQAGWHAGGTGNKNYIGIEMCEPRGHQPEYFTDAWANDVWLVATLCKQYNIKVTKKTVIGHYEAWLVKTSFISHLGSNHADPKPLFSEYGKTMDMFRVDVQKMLDSWAKPITVITPPIVPPKPPVVKPSIPALTRTLKLGNPLLFGDDIKKIQLELIKQGFSCGKDGADGIYGHDTEIAVKAFQKKHGLTEDGIFGVNSNKALFR